MDNFNKVSVVDVADETVSRIIDGMDKIVNC